MDHRPDFIKNNGGVVGLKGKLTKYQVLMACIIVTNTLIAIQGMLAGAYNLVLLCITVMYLILGIIAADVVFKAREAITKAAENMISQQIDDVLQNVVEETAISHVKPARKKRRKKSKVVKF